MNISHNGINLIKSFEGFRNKAYQDSANIWTIGFGTIKYPDGAKVIENDCCDEFQAHGWLEKHLDDIVREVSSLTFNKPLNQNQFDALCSFSYNLGLSALKNSTLYMKARQNPNDETIYKYDKENPARSCEFTKWITVNGKVVNGLLARRIKECDLYGK